DGITEIPFGCACAIDANPGIHVLPGLARGENAFRIVGDLDPLVRSTGGKIQYLAAILEDRKLIPISVRALVGIFAGGECTECGLNHQRRVIEPPLPAPAYQTGHDPDRVSARERHL